MNNQQRKLSVILVLAIIANTEAGQDVSQKEEWQKSVQQRIAEARKQCENREKQRELERIIREGVVPKNVYNR